MKLCRTICVMWDTIEETSVETRRVVDGVEENVVTQTRMVTPLQKV